MSDKEKNILIRQEKENPDDWHVAAQGKTQRELAAIAKEHSFRENTKFVTSTDGEIYGDKVNYYQLQKKHFGQQPDENNNE